MFTKAYLKNIKMILSNDLCLKLIYFTKKKLFKKNI